MARSSQWKQAEREISKRLGLQRNTNSHGPDAIPANGLIVEIKHGKQVPQWLKLNMDK